MILVGTTLAAFVMDDIHTWGAWTYNAEEIRASHPDVRYFAAIEVDKRGLDPFDQLLDRLKMIDGTYFTFSLDDGRTSVTTANRLRHITMGQNLVFDVACAQPDCTHVMFLAADLAPPTDALTKLLEVDWPTVGGWCPTYCLSGPSIAGRERDGVWKEFSFPAMTQQSAEELVASAAFMLFERVAFRTLRWRWDLDTGMSDDPCMQYDAARLGWNFIVRKDVVGIHYPMAVPAVEQRGHDMTVYR